MTEPERKDVADAEDPIDAEVVEVGETIKVVEPKSKSSVGVAPQSGPWLPPVTEEIASVAQTHRLGGASNRQRLVYALLAKTVAKHDVDIFARIVSYVALPVGLTVGLAVGFLIVAAVVALFGFIDGGWLIAPIMATLALAVAIGTLGAFRDHEIRLCHDDQGRLESFYLGRIEKTYEIARPVVDIIFFGAIFGSQVATIYMLPQSVGWESLSLLQSTWIVGDNLSYGLFLDLGEVLGWRIGPAVEYSQTTAITFLGFRFSLTMLAIVLTVNHWRFYRCRSFFDFSGADMRDVTTLFEWIEWRVESKSSLQRTYPEEILFLSLAKDYVEGHFDLVKSLSSRSPGLQVSQELAELFVDEQGHSLIRVRKDDVTYR